MTMMTLTQNERPVSSGFRVDVSRGERVGRGAGRCAVTLATLQNSLHE